MVNSSTPIINPLTGQTISEKLTKNNHALWKMQVLAIIRGVGLEGYLTGPTPSPVLTINVKDLDSKEETDVPNPDLQMWKVTNQHAGTQVPIILHDQRSSILGNCMQDDKRDLEGDQGKFHLGQESVHRQLENFSHHHQETRTIRSALPMEQVWILATLGIQLLKPLIEILC
jgi:hypothetical protein